MKLTIHERWIGIKYLWWELKKNTTRGRGKDG